MMKINIFKKKEKEEQLPLFFGKPSPGYEKEYRDVVKKLEVYHVSGHGKSKGLMSGRSPKQVIAFYNRINPCICGGTPIVIEGECMGDFDLIIKCSKCKRRVIKSMYEGKKPGEYEDLCINDWNNGSFFDDTMLGLK